MLLSRIRGLLFVICLVVRVLSVQACQVCTPFTVAPGRGLPSYRAVGGGLPFCTMDVAKQRPALVVDVALAHHLQHKRHEMISLHGNIYRSDQERDDNLPDSSDTEDEDSTTTQTTVMTSAMIASIGFYKNWISPILPPACRFVPTCSQYGVAAISKYGPTKGAILTAWRILRCSPLGGKGYDPPIWPPVSYTHSSY